MLALLERTLALVQPLTTPESVPEVARLIADGVLRTGRVARPSERARLEALERGVAAWVAPA